MSEGGGSRPRKETTVVHLIERKIVRRQYASPGRARAAIGRSNLSKAESKRLLALVEAWQSAPEPDASPQPKRRPYGAGSRAGNGHGSSPELVVAGTLAPSASPSDSRRQVRLSTVFRAHRMLAELAEAEGASFLDLMGDVQAYEISIRSEVSRRESHGSIEEVEHAVAGPDPS